MHLPLPHLGRGYLYIYNWYISLLFFEVHTHFFLFLVLPIFIYYFVYHDQSLLSFISAKTLTRNPLKLHYFFLTLYKHNHKEQGLQVPFTAFAAKLSVLIANAPAISLTSASRQVVKWKAKAWRMHILLNMLLWPMPLAMAAYSKATLWPSLLSLPILL